MSKLMAVLCVAAALVVGGRAEAAVPGQVSFTARLASDGGPVNGAHTFSLRLFAVATGGSPVWSELHASVPVEDGLVYLAMGSLTTLDATVLTGEPLWLDVAVDGVVLGPRLPIQSVPYAIRAGVAQEAESVGGVAAGDLITSVNAGAGLAGGGNKGAVTLATAFGGSGTANTVARSDHDHAGQYLPATTQSCPGGHVMTGLNANGTPQCANLNAMLRDYVNANCYVYWGWRDSCDGCGDPPAKWGLANGAGGCGVNGGDSGCYTHNMGGNVVTLIGINPDGDVNTDDKLYVGMRCY